MALLTNSARVSHAAISSRRWSTLRVWAVLLCALAAPAHAQPKEISDEYRVKAVFLFNFAQFVEWPAGAFVTTKAPFVIGLLGDDPFGPYLDELVSGEKVGEHPFVIERYQNPRDATHCHILFISRSQSGELDKILPVLNGKNVLTISDAESFTRHGGMVRFVTENGKIRLRISVDTAKSSGLTISSKILRPATIVGAGKD